MTDYDFDQDYKDNIAQTMATEVFDSIIHTNAVSDKPAQVAWDLLKDDPTTQSQIPKPPFNEGDYKLINKKTCKLVCGQWRVISMDGDKEVVGDVCSPDIHSDAFKKKDTLESSIDAIFRNAVSAKSYSLESVTADTDEHPFHDRGQTKIIRGRQTYTFVVKVFPVAEEELNEIAFTN